MSKKDAKKDLDQLGERVLRSLQGPKARKALARAFRASAKELSRAALRARHAKR